MNSEHSYMAASSISHAADMAGLAIRNAASCYESWAVILRPRLSIDGNQWCALYGDNLQDGVAGFGSSPAEAFENFDSEFRKTLPAPEGE